MTNIASIITDTNQNKALDCAGTNIRDPLDLNDAEMRTLASRTRSAEIKMLWRTLTGKLGFAQKPTTARIEDNGANDSELSESERLPIAA